MGLFAVATLLLPAVAAVPLLALDAPSAAAVVLSTFDGNKATTTNDPDISKMAGGLSSFKDAAAATNMDNGSNDSVWRTLLPLQLGLAACARLSQT